MNVQDFINKWRAVELTERSASQQQFLDLCEVVGHLKPEETDPKGEWFTFERGAAKHGGGHGWADAWKRDDGHPAGVGRPGGGDNIGGGGGEGTRVQSRRYKRGVATHLRRNHLKGDDVNLQERLTIMEERITYLTLTQMRAHHAQLANQAMTGLIGVTAQRDLLRELAAESAAAQNEPASDQKGEAD